MTSNPKRALILYNFDHAHPETTPALNTLCQRGCGGQLMLESFPCTEKGKERLQDIIQLLGLSGCNSVDEMKSKFAERFGSMKLGFISSCPTIMTLAHTLGFKTSFSTPTTSVITKEMILEAIQDTSLDVLFVDMSDSSSKDLDHVVAEILDTTPDLLKCIVMHATLQQQQQQEMQQKQDDTPIQSSMTKNGIQVNVLERDSLVCAYYHDGSTRRDHIHEFSIQDIVNNGCNGSILAWHYLAEIGHKLGHVPKYGA